MDARARPTRFAVTITALLVVLSVNCRRGGRAPAPGVYRGAPVILISIDTLRADHLALYGYRSGNTPILDGLGRNDKGSVRLAASSRVSRLTVPPRSKSS